MFSAFLLMLAAGSVQASQVLFVADSHGMGPFGEAVVAGLQSVSDTQVTGQAVGGSAPNWFYAKLRIKCAHIREARPGKAGLSQPYPCQADGKVPMPQFEGLVKGKDAVVVALGTNLIIDPRGLEFARTSSEQMVRSIQAQGAICLWVGPPRMRRFDDARTAALYDALHKAMRGDGVHEPCRLIDSRELTRYPKSGGDGVHFSFSAGIPIAKEWGRRIAEELNALSASKLARNKL